MQNKRQNKIKQGGIRLDPAIDAKLHELATSTGQTVTWWIENLLAHGLGLPSVALKNIKTKKGQALNDITSKTTRSQSSN